MSVAGAMRATPRWAVAMLAVLAGCADRSPLEGGGTAEDQSLIAIGEAFAAKDCATVETLSLGFTTTSVPRYDAVTTWLGRCQYRDGDFDAAAETLAEPAARLPAGPHTPDAAYYAGRATYRTDAYEVALTALGGFEARFPHSARRDDALYWAGRALLHLDRPTEALAAFRGVLADPVATDSRRARATWQAGRAEVALAEEADDPSSPRWAAAAQWFQDALAGWASGSVADDAACDLAVLPYHRGRWTEAEQALGAFLAAWPNAGVRYRADWYRARAIEEQGDLDRAIAAYAAHEAAYADHSYADDARFRRGRALSIEAEGGGDWAAAEDMLRGFLADWPTSSLRPGAAWYLGRATYEQGRFEEAVGALAEAVDAATSVYNDNALYYTGRAWYRVAWRGQTARYTDAVDAFDLLASRWPESSYVDNAAYFRARALFALGQAAEAEAGLEALLTEHPDSPYVDNALYWLVRVRLSGADCTGAAAALAALKTTDSPYVAKAVARFEASACAGGAR